MTTIRTLSSRAGGDHVALGIVTLLVAFGLMAASFSGITQRLFAGGGRTVNAVFANAQQLRKGDPVRIGGVDVGKVKDVRLDAGAGQATVVLRLDDSAGPLYADAHAALRWRTVLGASYAVSLQRGTPAAGDLGSQTIPRSHTSAQVEVEDLASLARGGARTGLQTMPGELARALRDARAPSRALRTLADVAPAVDRGVGALRGQQLDRDLRTLVAATSATMRGLDTPTDELQRVVAGAAATLATTGAHGADLRSTIAQGPGVLARTAATVRRLDHTLGLADPLIARLHGPAADVAPTVAQLRPTVAGADRLLRRAVPLLVSLRPAVTSLASAARQGLPVIDGLAPSLARLDKTILPFLAEKDPETQRSATEMIGPTFTGLGSGAAGQEDENGHFIRFPATSGSSPFYLPCQIYAGNPDKDKIVACKSLQDALHSLLTYNPLGPAPGTAPGGKGR
jgi:ABC-type transporter Mla subunit MlaD